VQNLIICIYTYNKEKKDGLKRIYRYFVGSITNKNDIFFVVGCGRSCWKKKDLKV
jgi:hypothetical protein